MDNKTNTSATNADENYVVNRSIFTRQDAWIPQLIGNDSKLGWFYVQFQSCFGRSAAVDPAKPLSEVKGMYLRHKTMAKLMTGAGYAVELATVERHLASLVKLGILAKAKVTPHPRSRIIYLINNDGPFQYQALAEQKALEQREKSPYKNQAKNAAAKKAREAAAVTIEEEVPTIITSEAGILAEKKLDERIGVIAEIMCQSFSDQGRAEILVFNYLKKDGNVCDAIKAMKDIKNKQLPLTSTCFEFGLKSHDVFLTREENTWADAARDELNRLRQTVKAAEADEHFADVAESFKLQRQVQELEQERIKNTAAIEVKKLSDDEILEAMAASLQDMDI